MFSPPFSVDTTHWLSILLITTLIFAVDIIFLLVLSRYFDPLRKRLDSIVQQRKTNVSGAVGINALLFRLARKVFPSPQDIHEKTRERLSLAGYRSRDSLAIYYFIRLLSMIVLPLLILVITFFFPKLTSEQSFFFTIGGFMLGMIGPSYFLDQKAAAYQRTLRRALPDAIDLLVVCTEAGLGLNAALLRVANELADSQPALSDELLLVTAEIRAGVGRDKAMMNLADRTGMEDVKGLVAILGQSMRFGTSIAQSLRVYAEEFRDKRMQKADEEAAKMATKMVFPLVFCFFPVFFIVVLGPSVINIIAFK